MKEGGSLKRESARGEDAQTLVSARFERQKQRIIGAATEILNRKGVWGMTLQEVGAALGLATSSVTYYFKKRELLAAAVFEESLHRLNLMAREAAKEPTPRSRVERYVDLYFRHYAGTLRGERAPRALLSEIRALDDRTRGRLVNQYQDVFRVVRGFFGPADSPERQRLLIARAHILNEALFWSEVWLQQYAVHDFPDVRRRLIALLDGGLAGPAAVWNFKPVNVQPLVPKTGPKAFLPVATRLINEFGYRGASVERITGDLNRNKATFYRHIQGKDELVAACSRKSYNRVAALQRLARRTHDSPWDRLTTTLGSALSLQFGDDFPLLRSSALQALPEELRRVAIDQANRTALGFMGSLVDAMAEGRMRTVDPLIASHVLLSAIDGAYDLKGWRTRQPAGEAVSTYMSVLMTGLFDSE